MPLSAGAAVFDRLGAERSTCVIDTSQRAGYADRRGSSGRCLIVLPTNEELKIGGNLGASAIAYKYQRTFGGKLSAASVLAYKHHVAFDAKLSAIAPCAAAP